MKSETKKILIIGINFSPELTGIGKYTGEMAEWLSGHNYTCTVVTSFPYYPNWKVQKPYSALFYKKEILKAGNLKVYRCPFYVPAVPSGLKRIIHESSFFVSAFLLINYLLFKKRNDYIICISPPFHLGFLALYYRFFKGGKLNNHIQDMQIEAARDLKVVKSARIFDVLFALERFILKRVNTISSISEGMVSKISAKTGREILMFPNWVDTVKFTPLKFRDDLKTMWGYSKTNKVVLYSGSIGEKQGLDSLINIAVKCMNEPEIRFLICGTGPYKQKLEDLSKSMGASNVRFLPLQDADVFNQFLNMADVHLILQKAEAADLVMPSKLTTILASGGLTIATALPGTSLYEVIAKNNMGIITEPENEAQLMQAILKACKENFDLERSNARAYAEKYLDRENILEELCKSVLN